MSTSLIFSRVSASVFPPRICLASNLFSHPPPPYFDVYLQINDILNLTPSFHIRKQIISLCNYYFMMWFDRQGIINNIMVFEGIYWNLSVFTQFNYIKY